MTWQDQCIRALKEQNLFESDEHQSRFRELMDCYSSYPFFNTGLCKCMYLSAWDEEHFCIMLQNLTEMTLGNERNTEEMQNRGTMLAKEQTDSQYYVYLLSCSFLENQPYHLSEDVKLEPKVLHIIQQALKASEVIDAL